MKKMFFKFILIVRFYYFLIVDKIYKNKINKLEFEIDESKKFNGYNEKKFAEDISDRKKWILKFCKHSSYRVRDICEREELTYLFGRLLNIPMIPATVMKSGKMTSIVHGKDNFIQDKFVLLPYLEGKNLKEVSGLDNILNRNKNIIADSLIFYHWIGDEDLGLSDIMINKDDIFFIDNGLSGPGHSKNMRGAHPCWEDFSTEDILIKCHRSKKDESLIINLFNKVKDFRSFLYKSSMIKKIESIPSFIISSYVNNFYLKDPQNNDFRSKYKNELVKRQKDLISSFREWLEKIKKLHT